MSRRHSSSRRRNYGRRQHEVRERRPTELGHADWEPRLPDDDWQMPELEEDRPSRGAADGFGGARL